RLSRITPTFLLRDLYDFLAIADHACRRDHRSRTASVLDNEPRSRVRGADPGESWRLAGAADEHETPEAPRARPDRRPRSDLAGDDRGDRRPRRRATRR